MSDHFFTRGLLAILLIVSILFNVIMIIKCQHLGSETHLDDKDAIIICGSTGIQLNYHNYNPNVKLGTICNYAKELRGSE